MLGNTSKLLLKNQHHDITGGLGVIKKCRSAKYLGTMATRQLTMLGKVLKKLGFNTYPNPASSMHSSWSDDINATERTACSQRGLNC